MPQPSSGAAATGKASWCFVRPAVDVWLAGGLSLVVFAAALAAGAGKPSASVFAFAGWLQWVVNWPHFSATNYRLLGRPENRREFPMTAYVIPFVVGVAVFAAFRSPGSVAPLLIKFFMFWSSYHFSAQSLGISLLYARRAGYSVGLWERRALSAFIYGAFLVSAARAEISVHGSSYYGLKYPGLGVPQALVTGLSVVMYAGLAAFALGALARWMK
jgi:hypothetical protein